MVLPSTAAATSETPPAPPTVTVCILSYNRPAYLREGLESVLRQSRVPDEIVILDNGSREDVHEAVRDLLVPPVSWEHAATNDQGRNWRRALSRTQLKYLYVMHDDDRLLPNFLAEQISFLETHPQAIAVCCNAFLIDSSGKRTGHMLFDEPTSLVYFRSLAEAAYAITIRHHLPFASAVYRNPYPSKVRLTTKFGKTGDQYFLCELARWGHLAYRNEAFFEYRVHPAQDSSFIPEKDWRNIQNYLVKVSASDPEVGAKVKQITYVRQARIAQDKTKGNLRLLETSLRSFALQQMARAAVLLMNPVHLSGTAVWAYVHKRIRAAFRRVASR